MVSWASYTILDRFDGSLSGSGKGYSFRPDGVYTRGAHTTRDNEIDETFPLTHRSAFARTLPVVEESTYY